MPAFVNMYIYIFFSTSFFLECINQLEIQRTKSICGAAEQESDLKSIPGRLFPIEVLCVSLSLTASCLHPAHTYKTDT